MGLDNYLSTSEEFCDRNYPGHYHLCQSLVPHLGEELRMEIDRGFVEMSVHFIFIDSTFLSSLPGLFLLLFSCITQMVNADLTALNVPKNLQAKVHLFQIQEIAGCDFIKKRKIENSVR